MSTTEENETDLQLSDDELKALAKRVAPRLEPGTYGSNMVLPRRTVVGVATGVLSASALLGWGAGSVAAQDNTVWNVGDPDDPANVYGGEGRFETFDTEVLGNDRHFTGAYDGSDADERLDNALSGVSDVAVVYLEEGTYSTDRTVDKEVILEGVTPAVGVSGTGTRIEADWTLDARSTITQADIRGEPTLSNDGCTISSSFIGGGVSVSGDYCKVISCDGAGSTVTFDSGTSDGIVDSCTRVSVTDNGSNTAGDFSSE